MILVALCGCSLVLLVLLVLDEEVEVERVLSCRKKRARSVYKEAIVVEQGSEVRNISGWNESRRDRKVKQRILLE